MAAGYPKIMKSCRDIQKTIFAFTQSGRSSGHSIHENRFSTESVSTSEAFAVEFKFDVSEFAGPFDIKQEYEKVCYIKFVDGGELYYIADESGYWHDDDSSNLDEDLTPSTTQGNEGFIYLFDQPSAQFDAAKTPYNLWWPGDQLIVKWNFRTWVENSVTHEILINKVDWHVKVQWTAREDDEFGYEGYKPDAGSIEAATGHINLGE
ncbi:MAG: hypothetical protein GC154_15370 [bacterium]|nr:hypothetical protein [bacterium]